MNDLWFRLRVLGFLLADAFHNWRREIWVRDLDSRYCCDGRECGCMGETVRNVWGWSMDNQ